MDYALLFPGQGSQRVGMGKALAEAYPRARHCFEEVDDALGFALTRLMWEDREATLTLTENAQPALVATGVALARVVEDEGGLFAEGAPLCVAGHSLGEYTALTVAGTLSLADAVRLVRKRGQAMQVAVPAGEGAMAALMGANLDRAAALVAAVARPGIVCDIANDNAPDQIVISGTTEAINDAIAAAPDHGIRRAIKLQVSAPFHCALMQPAATIMSAELNKIAMAPPRFALITNVDARSETDPAILRESLVRQVTARVRWRESVLAMRRDGVARVFELGPGGVLCGLVRRIDRDIATHAIHIPDDIARVN